MAKWGCAPWDNNDKHGRPIKKPAAQPAAQAKPVVVVKPQVPMAVPNPAGGRVIGQDGSGFRGARGVVAGGAGN